MNSECVITHAVDCSHSRLCGEESVIQRRLNSWDSRRIHVKDISDKVTQRQCNVVIFTNPLSSASSHKHVMFPSTTQIDSACATYATHCRRRPQAFSEPNSLNSLTPPTTSPSPQHCIEENTMYLLQEHKRKCEADFWSSDEGADGSTSKPVADDHYKFHWKWKQC